MRTVHKRLKHHVRRHKTSYLGLVTVVGCGVLVLALFFSTRGVTPHTSELAFIEQSAGNAGSVLPASCDSAPPPGYAPSNHDCVMNFWADTYSVSYGGAANLYYIVEANTYANGCVIIGSNGTYTEVYNGASLSPVVDPLATGPLYSNTHYTLDCSRWIGYMVHVTRELDIAVSSANACYPSANPAGYGNACTSSANACGQTNSGTISCSGACSASTPSNASCPSTTATLSASPLSIAYNTRSTLSWSSANATSCTAPSGNWSNSGTLSGSGLTDPLTTTTTFTFQCTGPGGTSPLQSATVTVAVPTCSNGANNPLACDQCPTNLAFVNGSCVACGNGGCTGAGGSSGNPTGGLSCNNSALNPPSCSTFTPTATLSASPSVIDKGQSSTLSWNSTNAPNGCTGTGFTAGGTSGSRSTGPLTQNPTSYSVTCTGPGGSATDNESITVLQPAVSIGASPARVQAGSSSLISWEASGVSNCTVPGLSKTGLTGSYSVTISVQSTFTITCQTNGAPITSSVTVNVVPVFQEF